jgi:beta-galactosidase
MLERDKNFPAILLWSLGNEAGWGPALDAAAALARARDPSRPTHYEGGGSRTAATDVVCPMYARPAQVRALAALSLAEEDRPVILCEYAHSMGNSTGNVDAYWAAFEEAPGAQGGFVWDWVDQALIRRAEVAVPDLERLEFAAAAGAGAAAAGAADAYAFSPPPTKLEEREYWAYGGDFGDAPHDGQFVCNGLVWPDRAPKPAAAELKHLQAPVGVAWAAGGGALADGGDDQEELAVRLRNKEWFVSTAGVAWAWRALADGAPLAGGWAPLAGAPALAPREEREVPVPGLRAAVAGAIAAGAAELALEVRAALAAPAPWAPAGHVLLEAQLPVAAPPPPPPAGGARCAAPDAVRDAAAPPGLWVVRSAAEDASFAVDLATGDLVSYAVGGVERLAAPLRPCLYRAATDNDRGGAGGTSHAARWHAAGLGRLRARGVRVSGAGAEVEVSFELAPEPEDPAAAGDAAELVKGVGVGEVGGVHWLAQEQPTAPSPPAAAASAATEGAARVRARWALLAGGHLRGAFEVDAAALLPAPRAPGLRASLPRVGVRLGAPARFAAPAWFGAGPHEAYADRRASAPVRRHALPDVAALHVPYVFPGECGGRAGARWVVLSEESGEGLVAAAAGPAGAALQFSASRHGAEALAAARHEHDLAPAPFTHLHLDAAHMGVGGDDSWSPSVHEEYLVPPAAYAFSLVLAPTRAGAGAPAEQAHTAWRAARADADTAAAAGAPPRFGRVG